MMTDAMTKFEVLDMETLEMIEGGNATVRCASGMLGFGLLGVAGGPLGMAAGATLGNLIFCYDTVY